MRRHAALVGLGALLIASVGCVTGQETAPTAHLSGSVTIGGDALPSDATGTITFRPAQQGAAPAVTVRIENGRYDSPQTPVGKVIVLFDIQKPTGRTYMSERVGREIEETESIVPEDKMSGINMEVTGDDAARDFDL